MPTSLELLQVADLFHDLDMGMRPISVIFPYLPIEAHRKRDAARKRMGEIFSKIITARRASNAQEPDLIQSFIEARYKDGRALTDEEITGMLIAVLFAGQHTSSVTSAWTGYELIHNKARSWQPVVDEQRRVMAKHGDQLDYDILQARPAALLGPTRRQTGRQRQSPHRPCPVGLGKKGRGGLLLLQ